MGVYKRGVNDIQTVHPELIKYWDYERNSGLNPSNVAFGSSKMYMWLCDIGHSYQASPNNMVKGQRCPYCTGRRVLKGFNDLATTDPLLVAEWDYDKNGDLTPDQVSRGSNKKVFWRCPVGHSWPAAIYSRCSGKGCPKCNSFGTSIPEQAILFYVEKQFKDAVGRDTSLGFELDVYIPSIKTAVEYDGAKYHSTADRKKRDSFKDNACVSNGIRLIRIRENGLNKTETAECIFTQEGDYSDLSRAIRELFDKLGKPKEIDVEKDLIEIMNRYYSFVRSRNLETLAPSLSKEWHPTKNGDMTPAMISANTHHKVWWICAKGHEYPASPANRYRSNKGCPYCAGQKVLKGFNDIATTHPELAKEWDYDKNEGVTPEQVTKGTHKKYFWKCPVGHPSFFSGVSDRVRGNGCPVCAGQVRIPSNSFGYLYPELIKEIHPDQKDLIDPFAIGPGSDKMIHWMCSKGHDWNARVKKRTLGQGCPYCGNQKIWPGYNDLETHYPDIAKEWDYKKNGSITPRDVAPHSNKERWWICPVCKESYKMPVFVRTERGLGHKRCKDKIKK